MKKCLFNIISTCNFKVKFKLIFSEKNQRDFLENSRIRNNLLTGPVVSVIAGPVVDVPSVVRVVDVFAAIVVVVPAGAVFRRRC